MYALMHAYNYMSIAIGKNIFFVVIFVINLDIVIFAKSHLLCPYLAHLQISVTQRNGKIQGIWGSQGNKVSLLSSSVAYFKLNKAPSQRLIG